MVLRNTFIASDSFHVRGLTIRRHGYLLHKKVGYNHYKASIKRLLKIHKKGEKMALIDKAQVKHSVQKTVQEDVSRFSSGNPDSVKYLSICLAEIVRVYPEEFSADIRIKDATEKIWKTTLSFAYFGRRSFFGCMPSVGDMAICGWAVENNEYKSPVILSWHPVGTMYAQDWLTTSPFSKDEFDMQDLENQMRFRGAYNQIRHKIRSISEGDILMSSEAGSDIILDEGVLITNRRANEILLRDADQTISFRALREQHTLAGTRIYSGIIQRDAQLLDTQVISDGRDWARYSLFDENNQIIEPPIVLKDKTVGTLSPNAIFDLSSNDFDIPQSLNPKYFLEKAGLLSGGQATTDTPYRVYGGKYFHRVEQKEENLTEFRIELAHTTKETLPVDDGTEGLDVENIERKKNLKSPHIEFVLGTAIGNNPYDNKASNLYGKPLTPLISQNGTVAPTITTSDDIREHAAYLMRIDPLPDEGTGNIGDPFFSAVTKNGRVLLHVAGEGEGASRASAEAFFASGLDITTGRNSKGEGINITTTGSLNLNLGSDGANNSMSFVTQGGFRFESQGTKTSSGKSSDASSSDESKDIDNGIELISSSNFEISSEGVLKVLAKKGIKVSNTNSLSMSILSRVALETDKIDIQASEMNQSFSSRATYSYSGPKSALPTNYPLRETKFTSVLPLPKSKIDVTELLVGEKITKVKTTGAVKTEVNIGKIENKVRVGEVILSSGVKTKMTLSALSLIAKSVFINVDATGSLSLNGSTSVSIRSNGLVNIHGSVVTLSTTATTFAGGILTSGTINPLTGSPFAASFCLGNPSTNVL